MVGSTQTVMTLLLLLLSLMRTGVNGNTRPIFPKRTIDITYPCGDGFVCFHLWRFTLGNYIAVVSNGELRTFNSQDDDSKCTLPIRNLTTEDVGHHRCQESPGVFSRHNTAPMLILMPGKPVSLQCAHFTYVDRRRCETWQKLQVSVAWVDETGAHIQEDSQHQIKQQSPCRVTLTVRLQSPGDEVFRCQVTVGEQVQTSVEFKVGVPALRGRGRGLIPQPQPEDQGRSQHVTGVAVGVVGCVVLTALLAAFVLNRKKTNSQSPDETHNTISTINVMDADEVTYAEIILPAGSDRVWIQDCEATEYSCVRYT